MLSSNFCLETPPKTLTEQFAIVGGIFGIWAEFTGFSLLGILNICMIIIKLLLSRLGQPKTDCLSNGN